MRFDRRGRDPGPVGGRAVGEPLRLLVVPSDLGYAIETDWRPNRVELACTGWGRVDVHPLLFSADEGARPRATHGGFCDFPASGFRTGRLAGREVGCFSLGAQRRFHTGHDVRPVDAQDLAQLDLPSATAPGGSEERSG